jgi:ferredoxin
MEAGGARGQGVRVIVDEYACIGSAECVAEDPEAMEIGDNGWARVLLASLAEERADRICSVCPVAALAVER